MKSAKVRLLIASMLALLLYGAEAYAKDAAVAPLSGSTQVVVNR